MENHEYFLELALLEAQKALQENETPIGAVLVSPEGEIVSYAHNLCQANFNPTLHAEMLCINFACEKLLNKNLKGYKIYISLEPCLMCLGAIINAHISDIYFSALDEKKGAFTHYGVSPGQNNLEIHYIRDERSEKLISDFFARLRK